MAKKRPVKKRRSTGTGAGGGPFLFKKPHEAVKWMNKQYAVVPEGSRTIVMSEVDDPVLHRKKIVRASFADITRLHMNRRVLVRNDNDTPSYKSLPDFWFAEARRRQYDGVVFAPWQELPGMFNLWRGFAVQPKAWNCDRCYEHLHANICRGNQEYYDYCLDWMANAVQHPGEQAGTAIVWRGLQGTGKGVAAQGFGSLFGQHYFPFSNPRYLFGHFNAHLEDAVVLFADEAFPPDDKRAIGMLKTLITEPTIAIEAKYRDVVPVKNVTHLILASNEDWVVPTDLDDRRFFVLDVGEEHRQNIPYFRKITSQLDRGGRAALLYDLLHRDLSTAELRTPPATPGPLEQKLLSLSPVKCWWFETLENGVLPGVVRWAGTVQVVRRKLHDDYVDQLQLSAQRGRATESQLGMHLRTLLPKSYPIPHQKGSGAARVSTWEIPPLAECRKHFDQELRQPYDWPEPGRGHRAPKARRRRSKPGSGQ